VAATIEDVIQTDAALKSRQLRRNHWCRRRAEVIGINTAIISGAQGVFVFAVASNTAQFVALGDHPPRLCPVAPISVYPVRPQPVPAKACGGSPGVENKMGALLAQIEPDGPAARAGLLGRRWS